MSECDRLSCEETFRRLDDYVDRELDAREMELVHKHLMECEVCTTRYNFEESVLTAVKAKLERIALPPELKRKVFDRLRGGGTSSGL